MSIDRVPVPDAKELRSARWLTRGEVGEEQEAREECKQNKPGFTTPDHTMLIRQSAFHIAFVIQEAPNAAGLDWVIHNTMNAEMQVSIGSSLYETYRHRR